MKNEKVRLFLVSENRQDIERAQEAVDQKGTHELVATASSEELASRLIPTLGERAVSVAFIESQLAGDPNAGYRIQREIRAQYAGSVVTVGVDPNFQLSEADMHVKSIDEALDFLEATPEDA